MAATAVLPLYEEQQSSWLSKPKVEPNGRLNVFIHFFVMSLPKHCRHGSVALPVGYFRLTLAPK